MSGRSKTAVRLSSAETRRLRDRAEDLLRQEIRFVYVAEFELLVNDEAVIAAEVLIEQLRARGRIEREAMQVSAEIPGNDPQGMRDWTSGDPLLTFDDEQVLFRAMNLLRFQINQLRARLSPRRTSAELIELIESKLRKADDIRDQLVRSNLRLVTSIARKFAGSGAEVDEFSSDGCTILLGAIDRFDYSRGFRFSTYATHSIQRHFFRAWKVRQRRKERFPNAPGELLSEIPQTEIPEMICTDPENVVSGLMARADEVLDPREHQILVHRFGLGNTRKPSTLREIAGDLGISKERVRQLQLKALTKLRELLDPEMIRQLSNDLSTLSCSAS
jgi:RNA polymerase primary sigma factor